MVTRSKPVAAAGPGAPGPLTTPAVAPHGWPVWGHDAAVEMLQGAVARDRVRHAYLIAGPDAVGKAALALAFAAALSCLEPPAPGLACGACRSCRKIGRGVHPDVQSWDLARQAATAEKSGGKNTSMTIETVRELCATAALRPMEGRWRVVLVDDAETLQETAQEALLKTLEEPPAFMTLLLLADDLELLLPTIRSRCQVIELRPVPRATVAASLVAAGLPEPRAVEVAALAGGRPGWAHRAAADPKLLQRRQETVDRALAWVAGSGYDRLVTAVRLGDTFTKKRGEVFADLETLLGVWRDALLLHAAQPTYLTHRGETAERLQELARGWALDDVHRAVCAVQTCIGDLEANVRPRLAMESMVSQWPTTTTSRPRP